MAFVVSADIGIAYERHLVPLTPAFSGGAALDQLSGRILPVQTLPALPFDRTSEATAPVTLVDLKPGERLDLVPARGAAPASPIRTGAAPDGLVIHNGRISLRLAPDGLWDLPAPGPIVAFRLDEGPWTGESHVVDLPFVTSTLTTVESLGPCGIQWRTVWRWGCDGEFTFRARWAAGADTLQVVEEVTESCEAWVEWFPLAPAARATALVWGGGERPGPMRPCGPLKVPGAAQPNGRRVVGRMAHISYFNQWNYAWVGFSADSQPFVGLFAHSGGLWEQRGHVRPEIIEDDHRGHFVRLPLKQGRRLYGLVFCTREESALASTTERNLLNRRKIQLSDLPLGKVHAWELNPPLEPCRFNLLRTDDVAGFRRRLAADAQVTAALDAFHQLGRCGHGAELAAAFWKADSARVAELAEEVVRRAEVSLAHAAEGGYECVIIFDGRAAKSLAYDVDLLWGEGVMHEDQYRRARKALLLLAYIFADPDYWRGGDFWPLTEPDEGIAEALKDDMGDCPVPPNFASEFFSTTGVVAELFPNHPLSPDWRDWSIEQTEAFLDTFFAPDGTYHESVNYHTHAVSELVCHFFPLWWKGHRDFFQNPRVKGSFRHFALIQMPPLVEGVARPAAPAAKMGYRVATYAAWDLAERALLPNNGNSGDEGLAQEPRGETTVAAAVYAKSDPDLAGHLMHLWATSGKALQDQEHPVLTLTTLDPQIRPLAPSWVSCQRLGLGIVSKARRRDGLPVWSLYRAGAATHHMDFDQGHLHLTAGNRELLGDYGYHAHDSDGTALPAAATWLHNTLTYGRRRELSSGYTGLERAPEPITVHLGGDFDWCVHRIINGNYRDLTNVGYRTMIPAARTVHVRHYLFVKPDYFVLWDTFEEADQPATFWLHPRHPVTQKDSRSFFAGPEGGEGIGLQVRFVLPASFKVVENARRGPLWSLGVQGEAGGPFLAILAPQPQFSPILATFHPTRWLLRVETDDGLNDTLILPPPGSAGELPQVKRGV